MSDSILRPRNHSIPRLLNHPHPTNPVPLKRRYNTSIPQGQTENKKKKPACVHDKAVRESRARHTQGMAKEERGGNQWLRRHHAPGGLSRSRVCSLGIPASSTTGRLPKGSVEDLPVRIEIDGQDSDFSWEWEWEWCLLMVSFSFCCDSRDKATLLIWFTANCSVRSVYTYYWSKHREDETCPRIEIARRLIGLRDRGRL